MSTSSDRPGAGDDPFDVVDPAARSRHCSWQERPEAGGHNALYAGIDAMRRVAAGEIPLSPAAETLGLRLDSVEYGHATMTASPDIWALNAGGTVHGGIVSGWVDSSLGYATATTLEVGSGYSTLDLTVRYIRALRLEHCPATIHAEVEHSGRSTAVVQVRVTDSEGRTCASASGVMMLFRP